MERGGTLSLRGGQEQTCVIGLVITAEGRGCLSEAADCGERWSLALREETVETTGEASVCGLLRCPGQQTPGGHTPVCGDVRLKWESQSRAETWGLLSHSRVQSHGGHRCDLG